MLEKQGNGVVLFCYNNEQLDYTRFAILAATYAKKQLNLPVSVILDDGTRGWMEESHSKELLDALFFWEPQTTIVTILPKKTLSKLIVPK